MKLVPMTNETVMNQINCFRTDGKNGSEVSPQSVLPDKKGFYYNGTTNNTLKCQSEVPCQIWRNVVNNTKIRQSIYTLYTQYNNNNGTSNVIPVRYEMEGFNSLMGSHYDHYYIVYNVSV